MEIGAPSRKRGRDAYGMPQKRAYWANKKFSGLHPWPTWGAARVQRGTPISLEAFGPTYKQADEQQKANRKLSGFTGRGKYGKKFGRTLQKFGKKQHLARRALDAGIAYGAQGLAAYSGGGLYGRGLYGRGLYGRGSYNSNVLFDDGAPSMSIETGAGDNQEAVITHCEYLQDVYGPESGAFRNQAISINPGLLENFPWLSQLAANYEEYEFIQLVFEFRSTVDASATNNTSGATGTIIMATNYNPDAREFISKEAMMQYHGAVSGRVTDELVHGVECDPSKNAGSPTKYVRTSPPQVGQNLKDFDLGKFQFGVVNIPSGFQNQQIGELWVSYKVRIQKPRLFSSLGRAIQLDRWVTEKSLLDAPVPLIDINTALLMEGVQNSTGVKIDVQPNGANGITFQVTFPSFVTNAYEMCLTASGNQLASVTVLDLINTGTTSAMFQIGGAAGGNNNQGFWSNVFADNNSQIIYKQNIEVGPATEGIDNTFSFTLRDLGSGAPGRIDSLFIQIQQSNTDIQIPKVFKDSNGQTISF